MTYLDVIAYRFVIIPSLRWIFVLLLWVVKLFADFGFSFCFAGLALFGVLRVCVWDV